MSVRIALLGAAALLVLGLGIYLFHEVNTTPAAAEVASPTHRDKVADSTPVEPGEPADTADHTATKPAAPPRASRAARQHEAARDPEPALDVATSDDSAKPAMDQKLDAVMSEANKAYDHGDFDEAKEIAKRVLARQPGNTRMLRILVSSSCIDGDTTEAQKRYLELPPADRAQMRTRCDRYGVTFTEK